MSNIKPFGQAEAFDKYVRDQIKVRQQKKAAGFGENSKTPEELSYLTSQTAWVRCASSTEITDSSRLTQMGFNENQAKSLSGQELAKRFVLFNGITDSDNFGKQRGGYSQDGNPNTDALYGVGGLDFGQVPMPGITSFEISHITNGALRQGTLTIIANNRVQFNIIDALYIRLGHTIFVEWGNNIFFDNNGNYQSNTTSQTLVEDGTWFDKTGIDDSKSPFLQFADKINQKRQEFFGNYDAFMGKVTNFETTFNESGQYEIRLDLVSTGDVIEGLKVNSLTVPNIIPESQDENSDLQIAAQGNESDIRNYLYCLNNIKEDSDSEFNKKINETGSIDFVNLSTQDNIKTSIQQTDLQYIRLGRFLDFLETHILCHINNFPLINLDVGAESNMRVFKNMISTDPSKCVINNPNITGRNPRTDSLFSFFDSISDKVDNEIDSGAIGNIYFKITHLERIMEDLVGDDLTTSVSLLDLLEKICASINSCFGGYVNIQPAVDEEKHTVYLRDTLYIKAPEDSETEKDVDEEVDDTSLIKIYGYTPKGETSSNNEASIVTGFGLKTTISSELSAQLSIGAASSNQSTANVNPFFKAISKGFEDIYQLGDVTDGNTELKEDKEKFFADCKVGKKKGYPESKLSIGAAFAASNRRGAVENTGAVSQTEVKKERTKKSYNVKESAKETYEEYISDMFDVKGISAKNRYFRLYEKDFKRGSSKMSLYVNSLLGYSQKIDEEEDKAGGASLINFIPIELNLELDGISGLRIYNRVSVDTEFLPMNYPEVIDFVILGIGHSLNDNRWVTNIQTLSIPGRQKNSLSKVVSEEKAQQGPEEEPKTANDENDIILFAPTSTLPLNIRNPRSNPTRNDSKGGGYFGASRNRTTGPGSHEGIDLVTYVPPPRGTNSIDLFKEFPLLAGRRSLANVNIIQSATVNPTIDLPSPPPPSLVSGKGTTIFAPITGNLIFTTAGKDAVLPGAKIEGTGKYKGYRVKLFYFAPTLKGGPVLAGQPIGNAVEITLQPKYAGVSNHLHFGIEKLDTPIDPEKFKYTTNPADVNSFEFKSILLP